MGKLAKAMSVLAAGTMAAATPAQQASACVFIAPTEVNLRNYVYEGRLRRECARLRARDQGFLREVAGGRYDSSSVGTIANAFRSGDYGCEKDPGYAFLIWNAFFPDPLPADVGRYELSQLASFAEGQAAQVRAERYRDIAGLSWLLLSDGPRLEEQGWSRAEVDRFLLEPAHWQAALDNFGARPDRDDTVFRLLTDPAGPAFDRAQAATLALESTDRRHKQIAVLLLLDPRYGEPDIPRASEIAARSHSPELQVQIAGLLLDERFGQMGLDAAQKLIGWYSPYVAYSEQADAGAAGLWQAIAARLVASDDPQARARGEAIRLTGDPRAQVAQPLLPSVTGELAVLDTWPEGLPPIANWGTERWAENYPARAIRDEIGGLTSTSLLFGPDGRFQQVWITRPSGYEPLDQAAVRSAERYLRPRLTDLHLPGFAGRSVLVPLVDVEWRLALSGGETASLDGRKLTVTAPMRSHYSDCGSRYP